MADHRNLNSRLQILNRISCFLKQARRESGLSLHEVSALMENTPLEILQKYEEGVVPAKVFVRLIDLYEVPCFKAHEFLDEIYQEVHRN